MRVGRRGMKGNKQERKTEYREKESKRDWE